jgi:WD40 repeat protein
MCWSIPDGRPLGAIPTDREHTVFAPAFSPGGRMLATAAGNDYMRHGVIKLWDVATGTGVPTILADLGEDGGTRGWTCAAAISANGRGMAAGTSYGVYSWRCGEQRRSAEGRMQHIGR